MRSHSQGRPTVPPVPERELRASLAVAAPVLEAMHEGLVVVDHERVHLANAAATEILGVAPRSLRTTDRLLDVLLVDRDGVPLLPDQHPVVRALRTGARTTPTTYARADESDRRWFLATAVPLPTADDAAPAVALLLLDLDDDAGTVDALRDSELRFRTLAESLPVGIYHADLDGVFDYANPRWFEITGTTPSHLGDPAVQGMVLPEDRRAVGREMHAAFTEHRPYHLQYRVRAADGSVRWLNGRGSQTYDPVTGEATGIVGSIEDVTPLLEARDLTARLAGIIESTSDLVILCDPDGTITYANRAARDLFGLDDIGAPLDYVDLVAREGDQVLRESVMPALRHEGAWSGELPMRAADGAIFLVWLKIALERAEDGSPAQLAFTGRDVTGRTRFEQELAWRATHDSQTGLPNRALLIDRLELALARSIRDGTKIALLFLDLDHFKHVNDQLGHDAGDELLSQVARRIEHALRPTDTVARVGGDEFVVLAEDIDDEQHAATIASRIIDTLGDEPYQLPGGEFRVTTSLGVALGGGADHLPEQLLRDADAAMYRAKNQGRARVEVFDESMRRRAEAKLALASELALGVERGQITVHYQPCIDLDSGRVTGIEALARWHHPERGVLAPVEFIGVAEETGLITVLGLSVLSQACEQARQWELRLGVQSPTIHVNLSSRQLSAGLPALVAEVLQTTGLSPRKLCLEITESVVMDDAAAVIDTLWTLKAIGVRIAIDDFGTGYSSLSYLRRFPVDVLKVDRSFVDGLGPDPEDSAIVAAIVNLASTLELDAVAEGVETAEQVSRLRALGCASAQGYLFSKPVPPDDVDDLLDRVFAT